MQNLYSNYNGFFPSDDNGGLLSNPTACRIVDGKRSSGCEGVEPCEVIFVKYGGEITKEELMPTITIERMNKEDMSIEEKRPHMCNALLPPYRPHWDVSRIFQNISTTTSPSAAISAGIITTPLTTNRNTRNVVIPTKYGGNGGKTGTTGGTGNNEVGNDWVGNNWGEIDAVSDLAIIVRAHDGYSRQLLTLLWMINTHAAPKFKQVRVIVIPTDSRSYVGLREAIESRWNVPKNDTKGVEEAKHIRVSLMEFPKWLFEEYGNYLENICNSDYKAKLSKFHPNWQISRFCDVNSPLHYLLCDVTLRFVLTSLKQSKWIMVTNADNYYLPQFFDAVAGTDTKNHDIIMSDMVTAGGRMIVDSKPQVGHVDLGAYAVSSDFLRTSNVSFLGALPQRSGPQHYHDTDGYYIMNLVGKGARVRKVPGFFFIHN